MKTQLNFLTGNKTTAIIQIKIGKDIIFADFFKEIPSKDQLNNLLEKYKKIYEEYFK